MGATGYNLLWSVFIFPHFSCHPLAQSEGVERVSLGDSWGGFPSREDHLKEACGIFGVCAPGEDVARISFFGIYSLQHRGQESAGIATADGQRIYCHTGMGLVSQVFDEPILGRLPGVVAIGHNRYSTTGSSRVANAQPIVVDGPLGQMALGHNGNIVNAQNLRRELADRGYNFHTTTDSEVIGQLIVSAPGKSWQDKIVYAMRRLQGAYSLVLLTRDTLFGVRDPMGVRPLCLGRLGEGWVLSSESCALDHIGAQFLREIEAGEVVAIRDSGITSVRDSSGPSALCIFEYIYFARPDSVIERRLLYPVRQAMGRALAREHPVDAELVIAIPDSATAAGIGYAQASGLSFSEGMLRNRYVGRTFIQPDQRIRELGVQLKFNPMPEVLAGKRVVVVDDSIVRGTTTPRVVNLLRRAGAKEIHMRICAPPIRYPCFFGVDMATRWELIAAQKTVPEICRHIGADSLGYLSIDGLVKAVDLPKELFCLACFTGHYPIPVQLEMDKLALETV
ncbi:MAG: amidophosphoribosyltransferase [Chloroflexi bacterium]|nr:amidophosphoribosyltransferase [Chloroflexota bacterium]